MLMLLDSIDAAQIIWYNIILSCRNMFHLQDDISRLIQNNLNWHSMTLIDAKWPLLIDTKLVIECEELGIIIWWIYTTYINLESGKVGIDATL